LASRIKLSLRASAKNPSENEKLGTYRTEKTKLVRGLFDWKSKYAQGWEGTYDVPAGGWRAASSLSKKARNFAAKTYALRLSFWSHENNGRRKNYWSQRRRSSTQKNSYSRLRLLILILKMQTADLNSPVIPQRLLPQHQQCSPVIDQLIQKAGRSFCWKFSLPNLK